MSLKRVESFYLRDFRTIFCWKFCWNFLFHFLTTFFEILLANFSEDRSQEYFEPFFTSFEWVLSKLNLFVWVMFESSSSFLTGCHDSFSHNLTLKIHNFLISEPNWMILFLFDSIWSLDYQILRDNFFEYQFLQKCAFFASWLRTFRPVLGLRVNDVGKILPFSMLCRLTWWTTFVTELALDLLSLGL